MLRHRPEQVTTTAFTGVDVTAQQTKEVLPVGLDDVPEVDRLLCRLGLGPLAPESVTAPVGRNDAWAGPTTRGHEVFVKRLVGGDEDVAARMARMLSFDRYLAGARPAGVRSPELLGSDTAHRLVVFARITDAETGAQLMVDETFSGDRAEHVGRVVGQMHATPPPDDVEVDDVPPPLPPLAFVRGLPMPAFVGASAAELDAWRLMQNDTVLGTALENLLEMEQRAPRVPSHCDFRVDQLLFHGDELLITDWEEFRLADPARDVGAFAGEWIFRSVLDLVTDRGDETFTDVEFTHEMVLQRGAEKMRRLLPLVADFWRGYTSVRKDIDTEMPVRATAFAGWHLLDRLLAGAVSSTRLTGIQRAAAGVGRGALVNPAKFASTLGFGEAR